MRNDINNDEKSWRSGWLGKNILSELPIIGGFFETSKTSEVLNFAGKSAFTLLGGSAGMVLMPMEMEENMSMQFATATAGMAIGMFAGAIIYNTASSVAMTTYYRCCQKRNPTPLKPTEEQVDFLKKPDVYARPVVS